MIAVQKLTQLPPHFPDIKLFRGSIRLENHVEKERKMCSPCIAVEKYFKSIQNCQNTLILERKLYFESAANSVRKHDQIDTLSLVRCWVAADSVNLSPIDVFDMLPIKQ